MNWATVVREHFEKEKHLLLSALADAKRARSDAPKPTESASDTTMSEKEKLVTALELDITKLEEGIKKLEGAKLRYLEVQTVAGVMKLLVVPTGMGGGMVGGVRLIAEDAPMMAKIAQGEVKIIGSE